MVQDGSHTQNAKSSTDDAVAVHSELLPHSTVVVCITVCPLSPLCNPISYYPISRRNQNMIVVIRSALLSFLNFGFLYIQPFWLVDHG